MQAGGGVRAGSVLLGGVARRSLSAEMEVS